MAPRSQRPQRSQASSSRGSHSRSPTSSNVVQPYRMHVSQRYLDLTKQKLELTRLPRDPTSSQSQAFNFGVTKVDLEPLVDHWLEGYNWRIQENFYNDTLPQYRTSVNGTRIHFVHKTSTHPNAIPLLFVHGFPESFITVAPMIDALCNPLASPGQESVQAFHVVAPSIPGFGFSDSVSEEGNAMPTTAVILDGLMKTLGYQQYIAHGSGWGFRVCRMLALGCAGSCIAIHTVNPEVPPPPPSSGFGLTPEDVALQNMGMQSPMQHMQSPPMTPGVPPPGVPSERPQTHAYALCDSPPGLLAYILDAIHPPTLNTGNRSPPSATSSAASSPVMARSPTTPQSVVSTPSYSPGASVSPPEIMGLSTVWTPTALINWAMIYWLPGPEVAMRWLANSAALVPSLWLSHSTVPLGITHFRDTAIPGSGTGQTPPQWCEAYHRVAMSTRREGRVRHAAWERPAEVVADIRELAGILSTAPPGVMEMVPIGMPLQ